ncbi:hypothetical protein [Candidatus Thiosymbion oneisti]|uniref:hypothetical protein n=1 Tax=Candidatus Thiosymbion oneisti TaxID=589554 RepID=UPI0013FD5D9F|nr:hypothetical protein [Candidatus Thiosymbion oneisti]
MMHATVAAQEAAGLESLRAFVAENFQEFRPFAYYDKHLDCIRVQIRDCSVAEERLSRIFTILKPMHAETLEYVGFTVKGVCHLFDRLGIEPSGVIRLAEILDEIVKKFPDRAVRLVKEEVMRNRVMQELSVDFAEAA